MSDELSEVCARVSPGAGSQPKRTGIAAAAAAAAMLGCGACGVLVTPARADVDPLSGIDFVHITDAGNAPWPGAGIPGDRAVGRGSVGYDFNIGRMEVTTAQWVEFFNAAFDRPDPLPHLIPPTFWGAASTTPNTPGGQRWTVPAGNQNIPVGNISWRMGAMYCNWLCNDKGTDRAAFLDGAYDVSTFNVTPGVPGFNDQPTHSPGARYWIPTWDEWLKAAHYDPDKDGPGEGGWWQYSNSSDDYPTWGPPGIGEANYGWHSGDYPGLSPFTIPLGAYPDTQSPWGLLDVAGATSEWTEEISTISDGNQFRVYDGSYWTSSNGIGIADAIFSRGSDFPTFSTLEHGLRIASVVPAPSAVSAFGCVALLLQGRRRRRCDE